ncbi:MAG: undecaprenyl-phosphate glucose phosphotransferase [Candidatus Eiseniibacteriota bacterium]
MFARHRQLFLTAVFLLDGILILFAWVAAYWVRFRWLGLPSPLGVPPLERYLWFGAVLTPLALLILRSFHLYRSARTARLSQELWSLVQGIAIVTAIAALASYFLRGELARTVLLLFAVFAAALLCAAHLLIRVALRSLRRRGRNLRHVLLVGTGELAERIVRKMASHPDYGFSVVGVVSAEPVPEGTRIGGAPVIGSVDELLALVERTGADLVYLALSRTEHEAELEALERLSDSTAAVRLIPDLARAFTLNASVEDFDGTPVVLVTESPEQGWNLVAKRAFDLAFSALGLVLLSPLLAAIAAWVKLDSPGPVFYAQERVGVNGRRFRMIKFRTMHTDAEAGGPQWTRAADPRRTRSGEILRRLSLDELPQLWNVLVGEMSLVGPRPLPERDFQRLEDWHKKRYLVMPGITGLWQVSGRADLDFDDLVRLDFLYLERWSVFLDLSILLKTLPAVLSRRGAF